MTVSEVTVPEFDGFRSDGFGNVRQRLQISNGCRSVGCYVMAVSGVTVTQIDGFKSEYFRN